jgi:hypothetical protein
MRKLTDSAVTRLRTLWTEGWSAPDLAAEFGVSRQHVGRIVREEQRAVVPGLDAEKARTVGVAAAVEAFLDGAEAREGDEALGAIARTLAAKIDATAAADTTAAAAALPRLVAELTEIIDRLRRPVAHVPDKLDELITRRNARRAAQAASPNGN